MTPTSPTRPRTPSPRQVHPPPQVVHPRAGQRFGDVDWDRVSRTPRLRLHGALILGILDPVLLPSPMSEEAAAWVRCNAWTPKIRVIDEAYPYGFYRWCSCQRGTCWNCLAGRCDICVHRQQPPMPDDHAATITTRDGFVLAKVVHLPRQRPCTWVCKCPHPARTGAPAPPTPATPPRRRGRPVVPGQDALFELGT